MVDAMADFRFWIWNILRAQTLVNRLPGCPAVIGAEGARGGNGDVDPPRVAGIEKDCVQTHASGARLPFRAGAVAAQSRELVPALSAIGSLEDGCVLHTRVDRVRIVERRLQVPHPFELPRVLRAVVPLVRGKRL